MIHTLPGYQLADFVSLKITSACSEKNGGTAKHSKGKLYERLRKCAVTGDWFLISFNPVEGRESGKRKVIKIFMTCAAVCNEGYRVSASVPRGQFFYKKRMIENKLGLNVLVSFEKLPKCPTCGTTFRDGKPFEFHPKPTHNPSCEGKP